MDITPEIDWRRPREGAHPARKVQAVEIIVFLILIVPSLALSFFAARQGRIGFTLTAVATIFRDLALVGLVAYFLWRNGESVASVGWRARRASLEVGIGAALFIPIFYLVGGLETLLKSIGLTTPAMPSPSLEAKGRGEILLAVLLVAVVAAAEETIFRGYLLLRFEGVGMGPAASVALSALVFSLGHGYEGSAGVVSVGVMGAIFAVVYLWRGSLVAPMTMHFLQDFLGIVVVPLLGSGQH
jgi:membrane protease YdiL (CAAX protease family)